MLPFPGCRFLLLLPLASCLGGTCGHAQNPSPQPQYIARGEKHTKGSYRFVRNSVCEKTPGVASYSGYIDVGNNMSTFFWFFEARKNPETAPLALWLNGGPGCSSAVGIFEEHGPCKIGADGTTSSLNPNSFNQYANVIYLDQPISAGFSYGTDDVYSTGQAAPHVWGFFQMFFGTQTFSKYASRDFALFTESYGGRYAPVFSEFFSRKNELIAAGKEKAYPIHLKVLGIGNGWFDPIIQYQSYLDYAQARYNKKFDLADASTLKKLNASFHESDGCLSRLQQCARAGTSEACSSADQTCSESLPGPLLGKRSSRDISHNADYDFPSTSYLTFLAEPEVLRAIGAESKFSRCSNASEAQFQETGDGARSSLLNLAGVLDRGVRTIVWAGENDFICNTLGGLRAMESMKWGYQSQFVKATWWPLTIKGKPVGSYKGAGPLTYVTIFQAGHMVPAYKPEAALEVFRQAIFNEPTHSVQ